VKETGQMSPRKLTIKSCRIVNLLLNMIVLVCILNWSHTNVTLISSYYDALVQAVRKKGKEKELPVSVIPYN
jgi:hypothetical protein